MAKTNRPNIIKLPSGAYRWRKRVVMPDGTSERITGTSRTVAEAERDMIRAASDALTGRQGRHLKHLTISDLVSEHIAAESVRWAPATRIHNQGWFDRHIEPGIGHIKAAALTPQMLRIFYEDRSHLSYSARNQIKCLLSGAYKRAILAKMLSHNPVTLQPIGNKRSTIPKRVKFFSIEEAERFNAVAKRDRFGMVLSFLLLTGIRIGEACGLKWDDIAQRQDGESKLWALNIHSSRSERNGQIIEGDTKSTSSSRFIYISEEAADLLKGVKGLQEKEREIHQLNDEHVFLSTTGLPMRQDSLRHVMKRLCEDANINELNPHALRHTFASIMISQGMDITQVSQHLGHKDTSITLKYYRHLFEAERKAVVLTLNAPAFLPERDPARRDRKPTRLPHRTKAPPQ